MKNSIEYKDGRKKLIKSKKKNQFENLKLCEIVFKGTLLEEITKEKLSKKNTDSYVKTSQKSKHSTRKRITTKELCLL